MVVNECRVYFATNRVISDPHTVGGYAASMVKPTDPVIYATADVQSLDIGNEDSGKIVQLDHHNPGRFAPEIEEEIVSAGKTLLVFIHGFANSFDQGIRRAAFNRYWFALDGAAAADTTILAFNWPSLGKTFAVPPHFVADDYLKDQALAGQSGTHLAAFFATVGSLAAKLKAKHPGARVILLAHSMGNYVLQAGVPAWFQSPPRDGPLFDEALLAAADERCDSFEAPHGGRLSRLGDLARRVSLYYSERDVAMYLSVAVNLIARLGFDGPDHRDDSRLFPASKFRFLDCATVDDYDMIDPPDASHQYYRRSLRVRSDIIAVLGDAQGLGNSLAPPRPAV